MGAEGPRDGRRASERPLHPASGDTVSTAIEELGDQLVFEHFVHGVRVGGIAGRGPGPLRFAHDLEAVAAVETLGPPAVEDGTVHPEVHRRLHAAGSARFVGSNGIVQPDVATRGEFAADPHVVLLENRDPAAELGSPAHAIDHAGEFLSLAVTRMGLAGEHDLDRAVGVVQHRGEPGAVPEDQWSPLVGREPSGEADGECVFTKAGPGQESLARIVAALHGLSDQPVTHESDQPGSEAVSKFPCRGGVDARRLRPGSLVRLRDLGLQADVLPPECGRGGIEPGAGMHAVGDRTDGDVLRRLRLRIDRLPHVPAHLAVESGDAVDVFGESEGEDRHAQRFRTVAGRLSTEIRERAAGESGASEDAAHGRRGIACRIAIVSGRDRGVGGEDRRRPDPGDGVGLVESILDEPGDPFDRGEGGMTFVEMMDGRSFIHRFERHRAAHPEEHLLSHPEIGFALVEALGEPAVRRSVLGKIGVEQQQRGVAQGEPHDPCGDASATEGAGHGQSGLFERVSIEVVGRIQHPLASVGFELLPVVAVTIEQADTHQWDAEILGTLHVVTGEHAEAAGILLHRFVDRELGAVVGDLQTTIAATVIRLEPARSTPSILERPLRGVERLEEAVIRRGGRDPRLRGGEHRLDRGVIRRLPGDRIEHGEGTLGRFMPGPGEVFRDSKKAGEQVVDRRC